MCTCYIFFSAQRTGGVKMSQRRQRYLSSYSMCTAFTMIMPKEEPEWWQWHNGKSSLCRMWSLILMENTCVYDFPDGCASAVPPTGTDSSAFIRILVVCTDIRALYRWVGTQSTCCANKGWTSTMLSVTVVIEAPNESDASVSMVLLLDRTTTEASSFPPSPYSLLVYTYCFGEQNNYCFEQRYECVKKYRTGSEALQADAFVITTFLMGVQVDAFKKPNVHIHGKVHCTHLKHSCSHPVMPGLHL